MANKKERKQLLGKLKQKAEKILAARDKLRSKASTLKAEVQELRNELDQTREQAQADRARIEDLERDRAQLAQRLAELQRRSTEPALPTARDSDSVPLDGGAKAGVALAQRDSWKRAKFLQDRYEHHLQQKKGKRPARKAANQDLMDKFGAAAGYSDENLEEILQ